MFGTNRPYEVHVSGAADTGYFGSEGAGDLNGKCTHAACRAIDEHILPRPDPRSVAHGLERRQASHPPARRQLARR